MSVDISSWPTKAEVCETLGLSLSQVNNLIKQRRLEVRRQKRYGAPPIGRIRPEDVAREKQLREAQEATAHIMPDDAPVPARRTSTGIPAIVPASAVPHFAETLATIARPAHTAFWLRWKDAVAITGLSEARLRELVAAGQVRTDRGPHGAIVLNRADLERHAGMR